MKLKKIASLALAGVMAVSMLAGCAGKTGTTENEGTTVTTGAASAVVDAFNDAEFGADDVKITFTYSSTLEAQLKSALANFSEGTTDVNDVLNVMKKHNSIDLYNTNYAGQLVAKDGETITIQDLKVYDSQTYLSQEALVKGATSALETAFANLVADNLPDNSKEGTKYETYTYAGEVAVVAVKDVTGVTHTYIAYTVSQTGAEATYEI